MIPITVRPATDANLAARLEKVDDLIEMMEACCAVTEKAYSLSSKPLKATWFGAAGFTHFDEIDRLAHKVFDFLHPNEKEKRKVAFVCRKVEGSIASCAQYAEEKEGQKAKTGEMIPFGGQPLKDRARIEYVIVLGDGFRDAKYSWGEKVRSLLHEFTHVAIATQDLKYKDKDAYGEKQCLAFAQGDSEKAYKNADNWAYYLGSYSGSTQFSNKDWKAPA